MRILADENCDRNLVARLREAGHDVKHVLESDPGAEDGDVLALAVSEGRIVLTNDLDFGFEVERAAQPPSAVVLLRLEPLSPSACIDAAVGFFTSIDMPMEGKFFVVEPGGAVRERALERRQAFTPPSR